MANVIQSVISLRYEDGDYHRDAQFNFKAVEEFKGLIGGVRLWNRVLAAAEISDLYQVHAGDNTSE